MRFDGIFTPIVTPNTESFAINREAFAETVEFLIGAGVSGIVLAGTTGEYYAQTPEERLEMMPFCKGLTILRRRLAATNSLVLAGVTILFMPTISSPS